MNTNKKLFNLSQTESIAVEDFAWAAVGFFVTKKPFLHAIDWMQRQQEQYESNFSQECWEACVCVFWRLVGVFACPHEPIKKVNLCKGITEREIVMKVEE